ncbi:phospholipase A [Gelidibacter salicanalis]|uniref:Phosphatidylcholine 1-acylhydrolase n=1 Tax=Gelidibacter salicanalis TaxID=291193 RepID=A0A934KLT8_9FLAO|nr:phospholipase A [Gelidibacter salicanalis]MBJ7879594.1 phospholipase A [Gelidibacter salicanalis]
MRFLKYFVFIYLLTCSYALYAQGLFRKKDSIVTKSLSESWELDKKDKNGTFRLNSYKPFYVLPAQWTNRINEMPQSIGSEPAFDEPADLHSTEVKFQISFKTKLIQSFLFGKGDIWVGYTQTANWQVYNKQLSRPFRELNYEPELIINYPLDFNFLGFQAKMAGFAFNHQSNGRADPISRSWNRIIFHFAMEHNNFQIYLKPWIRLDRSADDDDNPEIEDYVGRAEATVIYRKNGHSLNLLLRNSLSFKDNHGSLQFNYMYPIRNNLRGHLQVFSGYGENLIDYNHYQTTVGIGISFVEW